MYKNLAGIEITGFNNITSPIVSHNSSIEKKIYVNILFYTSNLSRVTHFGITFSYNLETPIIESFGI